MEYVILSLLFATAVFSLYTLESKALKEKKQAQRDYSQILRNIENYDGSEKGQVKL